MKFVFSSFSDVILIEMLHSAFKLMPKLIKTIVEKCRKCEKYPSSTSNNGLPHLINDTGHYLCRFFSCEIEAEFERHTEPNGTGPNEMKLTELDCIKFEAIQWNHLQV